MMALARRACLPSVHNAHVARRHHDCCHAPSVTGAVMHPVARPFLVAHTRVRSCVVLARCCTCSARLPSPSGARVERCDLMTSPAMCRHLHAAHHVARHAAAAVCVSRLLSQELRPPLLSPPLAAITAAAICAAAGVTLAGGGVARVWELPLPWAPWQLLRSRSPMKARAARSVPRVENDAGAHLGVACMRVRPCVTRVRASHALVSWRCAARVQQQSLSTPVESMWVLRARHVRSRVVCLKPRALIPSHPTHATHHLVLLARSLVASRCLALPITSVLYRVMAQLPAHRAPHLLLDRAWGAMNRAICRVVPHPSSDAHSHVAGRCTAESMRVREDAPQRGAVGGEGVAHVQHPAQRS